MSTHVASADSGTGSNRSRGTGQNGANDGTQGGARFSLSLPAAVGRKVSAVVRRSRTAQLLSGIIFALAVSLIVILLAILADWWLVLFEPAQRMQLTMVSLGIMVVTGLACPASALRQRMTRQQIVRQIDQQIPELHERWTSVTSFAESSLDPRMLGSDVLMRKVADEAAQLEYRVEPAQIQIGRQVHVALVCLAVVCAVWMVTVFCDPAHVTLLVRRFMNPSADLSLTQVQAEDVGEVQPRGTDLRLSAKVSGRVPESAVVIIRQTDGNESVHSLKLPVGAKDTFPFPVRNLQHGFSYRFRVGDGQTPWHRIEVADRPTLKMVELVVIPPEYAKLSETRVTGLPKNTRVLQGSQLLLRLQASEPLKSLVLQGEDNISIPLQQTQEGIYEWKTELAESWAFRPIMENASGLNNESPSRCELIVFRDQAPTVVVDDQSRDISLRPDDTLTIDFQAHDDMGISRAELVIFDPSASSDDLTKPDSEKSPESTSAASKEHGKELKVIPVPLGDQTGQKAVRAQAELALREFQLKHGQELSYAIRVYDTKNVMTIQSPAELTETDQVVAANDPSQNVPSDRSESDHDKSGQSKSGQSESGQSDSGQSDSGQSDSGQSDSGQSDSGQSDSGQSESDKSGEPKPEDTSPGGDPVDNPAPDASAEKPQPEADEKQTGEALAGGNKWSPKNGGPPTAPKPPGGEVTGKPRPEFYMAKQGLDTPAGQCTSCSRRRIQIDEWAGSYTSKVLDKLQLQIDPVLQQLKEELTLAGSQLQTVHQRRESGREWDQPDSVDVRKADGRLGTAEQHVKDLTSKSTGTPYAFIGLQLQDIQQLHIQPARGLLSDVTLLDAPADNDDLSGSVVHIQRALELLNKLTRQYDAVKQNQKLADTMLQIRKMHQMFLEGTFAMLKSQKPLLNPKSRAFMELDLTDEYLKQLQALLKKKLEIQGELAKLLAQDPRLLERYMARSRREATTLRDQLTLLNNRQKQLLQDTKEGSATENEGDDAEKSNAESPNGDFQFPDRREKRATAADLIAGKAASLLDNYIVWTPKEIDLKKDDFAAVKAEAVRMVATASDLATQSRGEDAADALESAERLYQQLKQFQQSLPALLESNQNPRLPVHVANRLQEATSLITDVSGWIRKEQLMDDGKHHLAAEVDQHRLTVDTMELNRKLTSLRAQCQGISPQLATAANDFLTTMEKKLVPQLEDTQTAFRENDIPAAVEHQAAAVSNFTLAEQQLDHVMDGIIKHLDSLPYDRSPTMPPGAEPESLDELLAMLEDEALAAEALGIPCCRPSNLLVEKDWFKLGSNPGAGSGGGSGSSGSMQASAQMMQARLAAGRADRIRRETEAAIKSLLSGNGRNTVKAAPRKQERAWNTLGSKLEEQVRQGRGNQPPEQYRDAIEDYFETLSGTRAP